MTRYVYGKYRDGPDPLAPPYDVRAALDEMGDAILAGASPMDALRDLLRRGLPGPGGRRGLDDLLREVLRRKRELKQRTRLDGTLERARALLDKAIGQERAELDRMAADPAQAADAAFRRELLDGLPPDTARAIRELAGYDWRSDAARRTFEELRALLRAEVLDSRFRGLRDALADPDPAMLERVRRMVSDLNDMLERDARGEHTQDEFDAFMRKYGDIFPERPRNLEELVDQLARRAAATQRLLASLTPEQRWELNALIEQTLEQAGLAEEMRRLSDTLYARRPDLAWTGQEEVSGEAPMSMGDAVTALEELADLNALESALRQDYPGARLDDIDEEMVRRALGRSAVDDLEALRRIERELEAQGYLRRTRGRLELTPKAVRRLGESALRRIFSSLETGGRGEHDQRGAGYAGEPTGTSRPWRFGDEQPIDVVRTVVNAVRRGGRPPVTLSVDDFEVVETERHAAAAVCLLIDLSYSMALRGTWAAAKQTALALQSLVSTRFPQDAVQIIGFSNYARVLRPDELASLDWDMVQGTNLHHALLLAGRHLDRHPDFEPVVMVITDGEPTAHLMPNGVPRFEWPPSQETIALTLAEVDKMTRRRATINVFMLAADERLKAFVEEIARRNGGRVFSPSPDRLGEYVVRDFLRAKARR